jgi:hypothetical protein
LKRLIHFEFIETKHLSRAINPKRGAASQAEGTTGAKVKETTHRR